MIYDIALFAQRANTHIFYCYSVLCFREILRNRLIFQHAYHVSVYYVNAMLGFCTRSIRYVSISYVSCAKKKTTCHRYSTALYISHARAVCNMHNPVERSVYLAILCQVKYMTAHDQVDIALLHTLSPLIHANTHTGRRDAWLATTTVIYQTTRDHFVRVFYIGDCKYLHNGT